VGSWRVRSTKTTGWCSFALAALAGCSIDGSSRPPKPGSAGGAFVLDVVDAQGAPLVGADVVGLVEVNPGPVASTCCTERRFASGTTGEDGRATLTGAPFTFRPFHFRASFRDWPPREVMAGSLLGRPGAIRIPLGPPRDVRGRVDLGPDCPLPPGLEVSTWVPETHAKVAADGSFLLKHVPPWATITVHACKRGARVDLEVGDEREVVLALPPAEAP